MESFGNEMFMSQEGYPSIDFTLLDRPSTSVASAPESTAPLLPDSSFPSFDLLDESGMEPFGVLRSMEDQFGGHGRSEPPKDGEWRNDKSFLSNSSLYIQGLGSSNMQSQLSTSGSVIRGDGARNFFEEDRQQQQFSQAEKGNWSGLNGSVWHAGNQSIPSNHLHRQSSGTKSLQHDQGAYSSRATLTAESPLERSENSGMKVQSRIPSLILENSQNKTSSSPIRGSHLHIGSIGAPEHNHSSIGSLTAPVGHGIAFAQTSRASNHDSNGIANEAQSNFDSFQNHPHSKGQMQSVAYQQDARPRPTPEQLQSFTQQYLYQKHLLELQQKQQAQQDQYPQQVQEDTQLQEQQFREPQVLQSEQQLQQLQKMHFQREVRQHHQLASSSEIARIQQSSQFHQEARHSQISQFDQQTRPEQTPRMDQKNRPQQLSQFDQQTVQQQGAHVEQQTRQHGLPADQQVMQLMLQAKLQQMYQARNQQVQLQHQARVLQAQQVGLQSQPVQALQLDLARQQQGNLLEQLAWQHNMQQLLANGRQTSGNWLPSSTYASTRHDLSHAMRPGNVVPQVATENHNSSPLVGHPQRLNAGATNSTLNSMQSLLGFPGEGILAQDPHVARQLLTMMHTQQNSSHLGSSTNGIRNTAGQLQNPYCNSQGLQDRSTSGSKIAPTHHEAFSRDATHSSQSSQATATLNQARSMPQYLHQQKSWNGELGQTSNTFAGPVPTLVSDIPSEIGSYNSQQSGWHSLQSSQVVISSDLGIQNMNAGPYMHSGSYQTGSADIFNTGPVKPHGSWSALMQSAVAESPSGDVDPDDWNSLNLQKKEPSPANSPQLQASETHKNTWNEQNTSLASSLNGNSFQLFNGENSQQALADRVHQPRSEISSPLAPNRDNIHENNQVNLEQGTSSQSNQGASRQSCGVEEQPFSRPTVDDKLVLNQNLANWHQVSWRNQGLKQVSSSSLANSDAKQQKSMEQGNNSSLSRKGLYTDMQTTLQFEGQHISAWQKSQSSQGEDFDSGRFNGSPCSRKVESSEMRDSPAQEISDNLKRSNSTPSGLYGKNTDFENTLNDQGPNSHILNPYASIYNRLQGEANDRSQLIPRRDNRMNSGQCTFQPNRKSALADIRSSPSSEDGSQFLSANSQLGLSSTNNILGESSTINMQRMLPRPFQQQVVETAARNQWNAEDILQDFSQKSNFMQQDMARLGFLNGTVIPGKDSLNPMVMTNSEHGSVKNLSLAPAPSNNVSVENYRTSSGLDKSDTLGSQNVLNLLSKADNFAQLGVLKGTACSDQRTSDGPCDSSSSDASLAHSSRNQSSGPLSPQVFALRLGPPAQRLQKMQGQCLQASSSHDLRAINDSQQNVVTEENTVNISAAVHKSLSSNATEGKAVDALDKVSNSALSGSSSATNSQAVKSFRNIQVATSKSQSAIPNAAMQTEGSKNVEFSMYQHANDQAGPSASYFCDIASVTASVEKEPKRQGCLVNSSNAHVVQQHHSHELHVHDNIARCQNFTPANVNLSTHSEHNQNLHERMPNSPHQVSGTFPRSGKSGLSDLNDILVNQQRGVMGAEKRLSSAMESSTRSFGDVPLNNVQMLLSGMDDQMKFRVSVNSLIPSSQQPVSTSNQVQENSMQRSGAERNIVRGISNSQTPRMALAQATPNMFMLQGQSQDSRRITHSNLQSKVTASLTLPFHAEEQNKISTGQAPGNLTPCPSMQQQSDSCSDGPVESQVSEPSDVSRPPNVASSRLHVIGTHGDFDTVPAKRLKIADGGLGNITYGFKEHFYDPRGGCQGRAGVSRMAPHQVSSSIGPRNFSSEGVKRNSEESADQLLPQNIQSQFQNHSHNLVFSKTSQPPATGDGKSPIISQYGNVRPFVPNTNERHVSMQLAAMYKRLGESGRALVLPSQPIIMGRGIQQVVPSPALAPPTKIDKSKQDPRDNNLLYSNSQASLTGFTSEAEGEEQPSPEPHELILHPKEKALVPSMIPWHVDISKTEALLPSIRDAELLWAYSVNRLPEKDEDEIDLQEQGLGSMPRSKKRLKFTSHLMQQLMAPLPSAVVNGKAVQEYENIIYVLARSSLKDAWLLASMSKSDANEDDNSRSLSCVQFQVQRNTKGKCLLKIAAGFADRVKHLDQEFSRLETSFSITDLKAGAQEIERLSILSRLAKHHTRSLPPEVSKVLSEEKDLSSDFNCNRKLAPQKYVTAVPMPKNLPDGVHCISL